MFLVFFFFKQKTAYEMRISDWSSDVCSSDLLPGGPLQFGAGVSVRCEAVDSPSINSDINGGTERYYRLNGFATKGHRTVYSAFAELNAPILDPVSVNVSGRYDRYSGGGSEERRVGNEGVSQCSFRWYP